MKDAKLTYLADELRKMGVTVKVLTVGEKEQVILELPDRLREEEVHKLRRLWLDATGQQQAFVLGGGIRVSAARQEDIDAALGGNDGED